jgi:hypothetical protein
MYEAIVQHVNNMFCMLIYPYAVDIPLHMYIFHKGYNVCNPEKSEVCAEMHVHTQRVKLVERMHTHTHTHAQSISSSKSNH